jgi:hypothetical protein
MEYLRTIQADDDDLRRGLRALGALLLGVGALVLAYRRSNFEDPWGDFALLLVALLPAVLLYGGGFLAARSAVEARAWHGVFLVFGLIFALFTFFQFLELIDGNTGASLNIAWIFAVVGAMGVAAALIAGVRFGMLAAGIAFSIAWFAVWDEVLGDDFSDAGTIRGLSVIAAVILGVAGLALYLRRGGRFSLSALDDPELALPSELFTAAGLVFLFGTGILSATGAIAQGIVTALGPLASQATGASFAEPSLFWDIVLLLGSLKLIVLGTRLGFRGPAYVGAAGLAIFVVLVGLDLDDSSPSGSVVGWPLILLVLGAAALAASVFAPRRDAPASVTPAPHTDPDPGPPPPSAP